MVSDATRAVGPGGARVPGSRGRALLPDQHPGKPAYHVSLPFFMAAILLLSPLQFAALIVLVHVADWMRQRRSRFAQGFNAAAFMLAGLAARATYHALAPEVPLDLSQGACIAAALSAAIAFGLVNRVIGGGAIWLGNRISPHEQHVFDREALVTDAVLLAMGVPLAQLALLAPWAAAIAAAPLWLVHRVLDLPNVRAQHRQDGLTELFTAPYLTETCTRELTRARRFDRTTVLLLLDVDGLGELNAAHGHTAGDMALRETARTIRRATREYDLPARLAGGLFAVLLPETDLAQAQVVAERIRRETAERRHEMPDSIEQARLTVSIGGAVLAGGNASATQLFEAAQSALARAKRDGGNQADFEVMAPNTPVALGHADMAPTDAQELPRIDSHQPVRRGNACCRALALLLAAVAAPLSSAYLLQSSVPADWRPLVVLTSLAAFAGLGFYFKRLSVALALAVEVHRSTARQWPRYLALAATGVVVAYAYTRFGLLGAIAVLAAAALFQWLAGAYIDKTVDSVRKLRTANEQLEHKAFHDPLTGLANRALFAERLDHAMVRRRAPAAWLSCSSTWTTSNRSTTPWVTPPAMPCCRS